MSGKTVATSRVLRVLIGAVAGMAVLGAAAASAAERRPIFRPVFVAANDLLVYPMPDGTFEVQARAGTAGPQYFCAAGDYAWTKLNVSPASRVVVVRPSGPSTTNPGGRGMLFTIAPQGSVGRTIESPNDFLVSMHKVGENFSVAHSRALCRSSLNIFSTF